MGNATTGLSHVGQSEITVGKACMGETVVCTVCGGSSSVAMRYGRPASVAAPAPEARPVTVRARGSLSTYADPSRHGDEKDAFGLAMVVKHEHSSGY